MMRAALRTLMLVGALVGCPAAGPASVERPPGAWTDDERATLRSLRLDATLPADPTNRVADDPAAAALGQALFFDAGLSPSGAISCATCHVPALGFGDGRRVSAGVGATTRNAPAIPGSQYGPWQFWDGRADSLWSQAAGPIESTVEMGSDRMFFVRRVVGAHKDGYAQVFGEVPDLSDPQRFPPHARPDADPSHPHAKAWAAMRDEDRAVVMRVFVDALKAVAAYERRLVPTDAPFDRYIDAVVAGDPAGGGHLDASQVRGLSTFLRKGNCVACHHGPMLTDRAFHNLGLPFSGPFDPGREVGARLVLGSELSCRGPWSDAADCPELEYLDPTFPDFQQAFKTPTLRGVALTAPYMHHGELATLDDVIAFYDELPGGPAVNHRELTLQPLRLTPEGRADLVRFLGALTGDPLPADLAAPAGAPGSAPPTR
jgi:cytochrome c peroxidase